MRSRGRPFLGKLRLFIPSFLLSAALSACMLVMRTGNFGLVRLFSCHQHTIFCFFFSSKLGQQHKSSCFAHLNFPELRIFISVLYKCKSLILLQHEASKINFLTKPGCHSPSSHPMCRCEVCLKQHYVTFLP